MKSAAVAVILALAAHASAQPARVDVDDLPPLPATDDEPSSSATVLAASAAAEDVVVGAAKREQSLGNVASAVTVIAADRLRRFGYRTVGEAVAAVAGAYLVDNRLSYALGIRGLQIPNDFNTRILVLIDGASVNEAWGAFAGVGFDTLVGIDEIARIEVIRGPVSSVYGTNAFFGIINIVTRGATELSRVWARAGGYTTHGAITSAGFAAGGVDRQVRGAVHVMNRFGEAGVALPDGGAVHEDADRARAYTAGVVGVYGRSFAQVRAMQAERETPFAPYDVLPAGPPYTHLDRQLLIEGGHARELTKRLAVTGRGYANLYKFSDSAPPLDPVADSALDTAGTAQVYGVEVRGRYEIVRERLGITAGTEAAYNRTRSTAVRVQDPDTLIADAPSNFNVIGAYAELDGQPLPWLGFTGGLRFDRHSSLDDELSPRAALFIAKPEQYGVKLLYAQGFRNPSAFEAYFFDDSDFARPVDLGAETIRSYEAVLWAKPRPGLAARLSGFYWDARDIIEPRPALPPEDPALQQFQNVTRYVSRGVEAEASYRDSSGWYAFGGAAVQQVGTEDAMGELVFGDVVNAPVVTVSAGVSTPKLLGIAHLSTEAAVIGERPTRPDESGAESPKSPAWVGWNVIAYAPSVKGFDITIGVRNLLGKRDLMPAPGDYDRTAPDTLIVPRVPGEGREAYVKIGYSY